MAGITKDQNLRYSLFLHRPSKDDEGRHFCRAMNICVADEFRYCPNCPLYEKTSDGSAGCWYYDISGDYSNDMTPDRTMERTAGFILAGITGEFPEYVADRTDEKGLLEERAVRYAAEAHKGTYRKGSGLPYIVHPIEVMTICRGLTDDADVIAAGVLHDVVEDTPRTIKDIENEFGTRIAALVGLESENKREDQPKKDTWKIRKQENLERERSAPIEAKMIMLADKISNMRATVEDHRIGGDAIWQKFNMKDPVEQEWYYRSVADVLSDLSGTPEYAEYLSLLDEVF